MTSRMARMLTRLAARMPRPLRRVSLARDFSRARGGNVVILFAFLSLPMLALAGAAIDYGFATRLATKLQANVDATSLLLCQTPLTTTSAVLNTLAQTTMVGAMGPAVVVDPLVITSNPRQITLTARMPSQSFFGKFTGTTAITPAVGVQCATPLPKTFEIALVLDNTGSMAASSGGQSKLEAAKTAAANFVDYVYSSPSFTSATKIAIVPFAASVAVNPATYRYASWIDQNGKSSLHWTNVLSPSTAGFTSRFDIFTALQTAYSGWGWGGCLETLPYPLNVQDGAPTPSNKDSYYVPLFAPDEPGEGNTYYGTYTVGWNTSYSFNSYIDDSNGTSSCPSLSSSTSFLNAEGRACKYKNPRDASPTYYNSYTGVPNGPNYGCTSQPLLRLTNDTTTLKATINSMVPLGSTNIHEGFMWGWRTISPNSVFADGSAYSPSSSSASASTINKIIILMTDGTNSWATNPDAPENGSRYFSMGYFTNADTSTPNPRLPAANQNVSDTASSRAALDALTAQACANAKAVNISIYTIGFSVSSDPIDATGQTLLRNCASSSNQFFIANDSSGLISVFNQIAASIGALRLTK